MSCVTSQIEVGLLVGNSQVIFEKSESSSLTLVGEFYHTLNNKFPFTVINTASKYYSFLPSCSAGKAKTKEARQTIINPDWNFEKMGIGGLDKEFSDIFRRAFASRVFPPDIVEQMGSCCLFFLKKAFIFKNRKMQKRKIQTSTPFTLMFITIIC